jgi:hypothetical protein
MVSLIRPLRSEHDRLALEGSEQLRAQRAPLNDIAVSKITGFDSLLT